jgi:hypothetical protein
MNCGTALLNSRQSLEFDLVCQKCPLVVTITVADFSDLYRVMNCLGWALIPSQHGREVKGLCSQCKPAPEINATPKALGY